MIVKRKQSSTYKSQKNVIKKRWRNDEYEYKAIKQFHATAMYLNSNQNLTIKDLNKSEFYPTRNYEVNTTLILFCDVNFDTSPQGNED